MPRSHDLFVKARNVPVAASVVWRHLARGRGHAATIGARAVPRLAPLADRLAAGQSPYVVSASAALAAGDLGEARERAAKAGWRGRSEEHTSELQSLMRISYAVLCLKKQKNIN